MKRYMLDTNIVSYIIKKHQKAVQRLISLPMSAICISVITEGELLFGLEKRPEAKQLRNAVQELLSCFEILPWNSAVAKNYSQIRANMEKKGKTLASLDMLIAAHALSADAILVTGDSAFKNVPHLVIENWV